MRKIAEKTGRRLVVGKNSRSEEALRVAAELAAAGVTVQEQVPYDALVCVFKCACGVWVCWRSSDPSS